MARKLSFEDAYSQTFGSFDQGVDSGTFLVKIENRESVNGEVQVIENEFNIELFGPFMIFDPVIDNSNVSVPSFSIFTLYFMVRLNSYSCSLEFLPVFTRVAFNIIITFKSLSEAQYWIKKFRSLRIMANKTDQIFPPISCPIVLYDPATNPQKTDLELSFINNKISIITSSNKLLFSFNVSTETSFIFISPFKNYKGDHREFSFTFIQPNWIDKAIICNSKWSLALITLTIYLMTSRTYVQNLKKIKNEIIYAAKIPSREQDNEKIDELNLTIEYPIQKVCEPFDVSPKLQFKSVIVPEKASSRLELLSFEFKLNRKIYFTKLSHQIPKKITRNKKFYPKALKFEDEVAKLTNNYPIEINIQTDFEKQVENTEDSQKIDYLYDFLNPIVASQEILDICKEFQFETEHLRKRVNGYQFSKDLGKLVLELSNCCSVENKSFCEICSGIARVLLKGTEHSKFIDEIRSIVPNSISKYIPNYDVDINSKLTFFVARLMITKNFSKFIHIIMKEYNWRCRIYRPTAPMYSSIFIELLIAAVLPIFSMKFTGTLKYDVLVNNKWSKDFYPPSQKLAKHINEIKKILNQETPENIQNIIHEFVNIIINDFMSAYIAPKPCPLQFMRNSWYCFVLGASRFENFSINLMCEAVESYTILLKDPNAMQESLLMQGLRKGLCGTWCLAAIIAGREEEVFDRDSFLFDDVEMLAYIDNIHEFSKIIADLSYDLTF